jgi:lipopolysaccharide/colanic/teichoic acid biosynthesis glycosyltransferase
MVVHSEMFENASHLNGTSPNYGVLPEDLKAEHNLSYDHPAPFFLPMPSWYTHFKVVVDVVAAFALLLLTAPLICFCAVLVKLTSRGPAFYSQTRVGKDGRPFRLLKLRTMTNNCEKDSGPRWALERDPRVTWLGGFLRRTHLDELPQLWNVLRGEMSLVGPRPERPEFVPKLDQAIPHYCARLVVRPGVTGLAQVQLPADTNLASVRRKLAYDLYYIRQQSLWLDIRLIICTAIRVIGIPFYPLCQLFRIPGRYAVERTCDSSLGLQTTV